MSKNKRISDVDKCRIYKCFKIGDDWQSLARHLDISINAARQIIKAMIRRNGIPSLPPGGSFNKKLIMK